jgi:hypothetical protein
VGISLRCALPVASVCVAAISLLQIRPAIADSGQAEKPRSTLTADEQKLLNGLFKQGLFDPTGAERVRVKTSVRTVEPASKYTVREAWFKAGAAGAQGKIVFIDGEERSVPNRGALETVDFIAACQSRFVNLKPEAREEMQRRAVRFHQSGREPEEIREIDRSPLATAAWLHRLGHDELAVRALSEARSAASIQGQRSDEEWLVTGFRSELAWITFEEMIDAFTVCADDEALAAGERLMRLYPSEVEQFRQSEVVLADLRRRQKTGTFGKARLLQWPAEFKRWDVGKQTAWLIDSLEQADGRPFKQPARYVVLAEDPLVQTLIRVGDPAVPALIAAIEKDTRLTRAVRVSNWGDSSNRPTILSVREAALDAVQSITGTPFFESNDGDDGFTLPTDAKARKMARRLQEYWRRYGKLPFDERMMRILTEPACDFPSKRQAATNLAHSGESRMAMYQQIVFESSRGGTHRSPAAAVRKFNNPTIASAILAALDDDLKHFDAQPRADFSDFQRRAIEDGYVQALIDLGDKTIAPELARRSTSTWQLRQRQVFASAAEQLGAPGAMIAFARQIEHGGFQLPTNDNTEIDEENQPGNVALREIIEELVRTKRPEADRALFAITDPEHPYFEFTRSRLRQAESGQSENRSWFSHPYCLKIVRRELDNRDPTWAYYLRNGTTSTFSSQDGSYVESDVPPPFNDPKFLKDIAFERCCDRAAMRLTRLVYGMPAYHPLLKDADGRLKEIRRVLDSFSGRFRLVTPLEVEFLGVASDRQFLPDLSPLTRPATKDDVKAGRAIFESNGKGKLAPLQLPAVASWRRPHDASSDPAPKRLMIVQAEIDAAGKTIYGVLGDGAARTVHPEELTDIKPIKKSFFDFFK